MKIFQVLSLQWYGPTADVDWAEAALVKAHDHQHAVQKWAEHEDLSGDYTIIRDGEHGPVLVREEDSTDVKKFNIEARSESFYYAKEQV